MPVLVAVGVLFIPVLLAVGEVVLKESLCRKLLVHL